MADLLDLVLDTFPANGDVGVPLSSEITLTLSGLDYDHSSLEEGFFLEGPDTDQYIGPGLIDLVSPNNVSQGDLDDFLQSPGYQGLVGGTVTVSGVSGNTIVTFIPDQPLSPNLLYVANLSSILEADGITSIEGFITFSFETGSGSIEEVPSTLSTSVLSSPSLVTQSVLDKDLRILEVTPKDRSVQNSIHTDEIVIKFNKTIDASSINTAQLLVETIPATDHPSAVTRSLGTLAKTITVDGDKLIIKI